MKYLVLALVFASALLLGSVPSVGRPTGIILVEHSSGSITLPDLYCDGRHMLVVTASVTITLPAAAVGLECNVIALLGTGGVAVARAGSDVIFDIDDEDGSTVAVIIADSVPGASVTLVGMTGGTWTAKRKFGDWTDGD